MGAIEMNAADKHFGPKPAVAMPPAKQSHFGRYPDVQELCDTFIEEMGFNTDPYTIRQVAAGARDFRRAIGNNPDTLLRALKRMKQKKLTIASPRSCITEARSTPEEDTQKYRLPEDYDE